MSCPLPCLFQGLAHQHGCAGVVQCLAVDLNLTIGIDDLRVQLAVLLQQNALVLQSLHAGLGLQLGSFFDFFGFFMLSMAIGATVYPS